METIEVGPIVAGAVTVAYTLFTVCALFGFVHATVPTVASFEKLDPFPYAEVFESGMFTTRVAFTATRLVMVNGKEPVLRCDADSDARNAEREPLRQPLQVTCDLLDGVPERDGERVRSKMRSER